MGMLRAVCSQWSWECWELGATGSGAVSEPKNHGSHSGRELEVLGAARCECRAGNAGLELLGWNCSGSVGLGMQLGVLEVLGVLG